MNVLNAHQVKQKIEQNSSIKLVMTLGANAFAKSHIPGSLNISDISVAQQLFPQSTEIIVYCSDQSCMASYYAYQQLEQAGYHNIWRFAGGLMEWTREGFPLDSN